MEQRQTTRYNLMVPAYVDATISGDVLSCKWKTRDVSSSGAFILTEGQLLENDTGVKVSLCINTFSGSKSWVKTNGRVVRSDSEGVGVCFEGQYQFLDNAVYE